MEYSLVVGYQHGEDNSGGGVVDRRYIGGGRNIIGGYEHTGHADMFIYDSLVVGRQMNIKGTQSSSSPSTARNIIGGYNHTISDNAAASYTTNNIIGGSAHDVYRGSNNLIVGLLTMLVLQVQHIQNHQIT
ncbi:MAG: hypothetical protein CM15mV19_0730 [uncultured marine virus]|nr:MAG: hypothetical protein CM15mV19_0730 [uncultured marine virus]